eukprot:scaffold29776_cov30-Tisochrysis_lutea.AAC.3
MQARGRLVALGQSTLWSCCILPHRLWLIVRAEEAAGVACFRGACCESHAAATRLECVPFNAGAGGPKSSRSCGSATTEL